jgi:hypothetical protein
MDHKRPDEFLELLLRARADDSGDLQAYLTKTPSIHELVVHRLFGCIFPDREFQLPLKGLLRLSLAGLNLGPQSMCSRPLSPIRII